MAKPTKNKKRSRVVKTIVFPARLVAPVGIYLANQLKRLKKRRKEITKDDPFKNLERANDNAAPDTDAEEQDGHARTVAVRGQLDKKIIQTRRALARIKLGKYGVCESCNRMINTDRLIIYPEATLCTKCSSKKEKSSRR